MFGTPHRQKLSGTPLLGESLGIVPKTGNGSDEHAVEGEIALTRDMTVIVDLVALALGCGRLGPHQLLFVCYL